jgi:H+/Cl- antiporter ClcA
LLLAALTVVGSAVDLRHHRRPDGLVLPCRIAAAAVLATTGKATLCAIVLGLEFTHTGVAVAVPTWLAIAGAVVTAAWWAARNDTADRAAPWQVGAAR